MLLVIQSIIVYGLMIWVMTYFGYIAYRSQYPQGFGKRNMHENKKVPIGTIFTKSYFIIPIFIFCLFAAIRSKVGVDCESYKNIFYEISKIGISLTAPNIEEGFKSIVFFTNLFTESHYLCFFILAFLQIVFLYLALQKERHVLFFLGISIILTCHYWSLMNGIRQNIAACAFVAMIPWLLNKKWIYFILGTMLAMTMHRSALLLIPIGAIGFLSKNKILNKYVQFVILIVSFFMMNKLDNIFSSRVIEFASDAGYGDEQIDIYTNLDDTEYTFGLRMFIRYAVYCCIIFYSDKMYKLFNSKTYNIMYNLFFIGICMTLIFYNNFTIKRAIYYITCFSPLILSYFMFYLWSNKKNHLLFIIIAILTIQVVWSVYSDITNKGLLETMLYKFDF